MSAPVCKLYKTVADLAKDVAWWQKMLRLEDWRITITISTLGAMRGNLGQVEIESDRKLARLTMAQGSDYREKALYHQDMEVTLVHELLHLTFREYRIFNAKYEEAVVEMLSLALVGARRGKEVVWN